MLGVTGGLGQAEVEFEQFLHVLGKFLEGVGAAGSRMLVSM